MEKLLQQILEELKSVNKKLDDNKKIEEIITVESKFDDKIKCYGDSINGWMTEKEFHEYRNKEKSKGTKE